VLNEILAKLNQNEKLVGGGAIVVVVGWLLGFLITNSWYGYSGAQGLGLLAVAAAVVAVVVLYLKYAPGQSITWPFPVPMILLGLGIAAGVVALLGLLMAFTYDPCGGLCNGLLSSYGVGKPITLYLATVVVVAGGALMAWGGYQEYLKVK
jgi:hypothetical protein